MVLHVRLEVLGQVADALAEQRDLDFRGACVRFVCAEIADDCGLTVVGQHVVPSTHGPAPAREGQPRPPLYYAAPEGSSKEMMLAEYHGRMQKTASAAGQGH